MGVTKKQATYLGENQALNVQFFEADYPLLKLKFQ